jgi:hypothetical protein
MKIKHGQPARAEQIDPRLRSLFRRALRRTFSPDPFTQMLAILDRGMKQLDELRSWIAFKAKEETERSELLAKEVRAIKRRQARSALRRTARKAN